MTGIVVRLHHHHPLPLLHPLHHHNLLLPYPHLNTIVLYQAPTISFHLLYITLRQVSIVVTLHYSTEVQHNYFIEVQRVPRPQDNRHYRVRTEKEEGGEVKREDGHCVNHFSVLLGEPLVLNDVEKKNVLDQH